MTSTCPLIKSTYKERHRNYFFLKVGALRIQAETAVGMIVAKTHYILDMQRIRAETSK